METQPTTVSRRPAHRRVTLSIPAHLADQLATIAHQERRTLSNLAAHFLAAQQATWTAAHTPPPAPGQILPFHPRAHRATSRTDPPASATPSAAAST